MNHKGSNWPEHWLPCWQSGSLLADYWPRMLAAQREIRNQRTATSFTGLRRWIRTIDATRPGKSPMGMDLVPVYADDAVRRLTLLS